MSVGDALARALADRGEPQTVRDLLAAVRAGGGRGVSRAAVERTLEGDARFVVDDGDPRRPRWQLRDDGQDLPWAGGGVMAAHRRPPPRDAADAPAADRGDLEALQLRDWQVAALAAWSEAGCRGVVEAVTGTGKTRLALAAVRTVLGSSRPADGAPRRAAALVLAPTLELVEQWVRELRATLPDLRIGRLGGGHDDDLHDHHVVVATPHSAATVPLEPPPGALGLLIADEAHRYGAPTWGAALGEAFALRLALTATYERNDEGVAEVLAPYFGGVVHAYGFADAAADGTIAPFHVTLVGVDLDDDERARHQRADQRVRQLHRELVGAHGMSRDPRRRFAQAAALVAEADRHGRAGPQVAACREYLARVRERRDAAAQARAKLALCGRLAPALEGRRTLVFTDTVEQAEAAARALAAAGRRAETVHGELDADRRRIRLAVFRRGDLDALVAPRVLDEGVDVPDADVAVVLAAFRTRRQLVQRLGRVLRRKPDGRAAQLVLLHAVGTAEDPDRGGHADFLEAVAPVAATTCTLRSPADDVALLDRVASPARTR